MSRSINQRPSASACPHIRQQSKEYETIDIYKRKVSFSFHAINKSALIGNIKFYKKSFSCNVTKYKPSIRVATATASTGNKTLIIQSLKDKGDYDCAIVYKNTSYKETK